MSNVIEFPMIHGNGFSVTLDQTYKCPECSSQLTTRKLWVDALINCRCGAEMCPVEAK